MKTQSISKEKARRDWIVVDGAGLRVGRLASRVAAALRGKTKPTFTPHADTGDFVIVLNAGSIELSGKKWEQKMYRRHSGYIGGLSEISARELHKKDPTAIVRIAVKGMLPRGPLGRKLYKKLKVYAGAEHPHQAQNPRNVDVKEL